MRNHRRSLCHIFGDSSAFLFYFVVVVVVGCCSIHPLIHSIQVLFTSIQNWESTKNPSRIHGNPSGFNGITTLLLLLLLLLLMMMMMMMMQLRFIRTESPERSSGREIGCVNVYCCCCCCCFCRCCCCY